MEHYNTLDSNLHIYMINHMIDQWKPVIPFFRVFSGYRNEMIDFGGTAHLVLQNVDAYFRVDLQPFAKIGDFIVHWQFLWIGSILFLVFFDI